MTRVELVENVAKKTGLAKATVEKVIDETIETIKKGVKKDKRFTYANFGAFLLKCRLRIPILVNGNREKAMEKWSGENESNRS